MATEDHLWKDINLSSLHDHPASVHGVSLQDFLGRPFANNTVPPPPPHPPATTRAPELHFFGTNIHNSSSLSNQPPQPASPDDGSFEGLASSPAGARNRAQQSGDQRYNRMMKNREAAARSRARKEARTSALELEVKRLLKENAELIKQYQELLVEAEAPKMCKLYRTSSAPF